MIPVQTINYPVSKLINYSIIVDYEHIFLAHVYKEIFFYEISQLPDSFISNCYLP